MKTNFTQVKLYDELYEVFGDSDRDAEFQDIKRLSYLDQVLKETLRRFTLTPTIMRGVQDDCKIGELRLPCLYHIHTYVSRYYLTSEMIKFMLINPNNYAVFLGDRIFPAGTAVMVSIGAVHFNPEYYPDPWKFNPDNFSPEAVQNRPKFAFIPFSMGARNCIGIYLPNIII